MGTASEHQFIRKQAAPALMRAMEELSVRVELPLDHFEELTLGQIYLKVEQVYGNEIPAYWRNWKSWDDYSEDPAPMGDPGDEV